MSWSGIPPNYPPGLRPPKPPPPPPSPPKPHSPSFRLGAGGSFYAGHGCIDMKEILYFDGERTVRFKNGEKVELPEALAAALRDHCAFMHRARTPAAN